MGFVRQFFYTDIEFFVYKDKSVGKDSEDRMFYSKQVKNMKNGLTIV